MNIILFVFPFLSLFFSLNIGGVCGNAQIFKEMDHLFVAACNTLSFQEDSLQNDPLDSSSEDVYHDDFSDLYDMLDSFIPYYQSFSSELDKDYYKDYIDQLESNQLSILNDLNLSNENESEIIANQEEIISGLANLDVSSGDLHSIDDVYDQLVDVNSNLETLNSNLTLLVNERIEESSPSIPSGVSYPYWILLRAYLSDEFLATVNENFTAGNYYIFVSLSSPGESLSINNWWQDYAFRGGFNVGVNCSYEVFYSSDLKQYYRSSLFTSGNCYVEGYSHIYCCVPDWNLVSLNIVSYNLNSSTSSEFNPFASEEVSDFESLEEFLASPAEVNRFEYELLKSIKDLEYIGLCLLGFMLVVVFASQRRKV